MKLILILCPILTNLWVALLSGLLFRLLLFLRALHFFGLGTTFLSPLLKHSRYSF